MAGSGKGKCNKTKGKSKYNKSNTINKQIATSCANPNLQEKQSDTSDSSQKDRDRSSPSHSNLPGEPSGLSCYSEVHVEKLLCERLEMTYKKALELLSVIGYSMDSGLKAILNFGCVLGPMNILANIVTNSLAFIYCSYLTENDDDVFVESEPVFENMSQLARFSLQSLVDEIVKIRPDWRRFDAMLYILSSNMLAGTIDKNQLPMASDLDFGSKNEPSEVHSKAVFEGTVEMDPSSTTLAWGSHRSEAFASLLANRPVAAASCIHPEIIPASFTTSELSTNSNSEGSDLLFHCNERSLEEWLRSSSSEQKNEMIFSLHKQIEDFKAQSKKQEKCSHEEVIKATEKLNFNLLEVRMSRMENMGKDQWRRKLQLGNSEIRSKFAASKSTASDSLKVLQFAAGRERNNLKKLADLEKQISKLKEEMEEQKQKNLQLEQELLLARISQKQPEAVGWDIARAKKKAWLIFSSDVDLLERNNFLYL